ncbi:DUF2288 domain-containing protein [Geomonas nitrogeniifigens]|uniref:DUF2288 domain-containing protein n=1 Tax=Geomonas diazotrophica TaxID=2843197 RepID=A0ABX8JIV4_9BACT|nr:DUF2288 domain-containing protein [Geomonas nitrogeniifigens]QWV97442.1 DUF2288 domain-containing protein [Geomonas nitrogeniifigens]QXE86599.1 DUF2288 domain-containing protein [Geomonas nitrogeniifigens]
MTDAKEELATKVDIADWLSLRAHLERGGVIVVDPLLELVEVGAALAADEVQAVQRWLSSSLLTKPSLEQVKKWDAEKGKIFNCLIVSPYVLIQEPVNP